MGKHFAGTVFADCEKKDRKHFVPHHCKGLAEVLGVVFNIFSFYS